MSPQEAIASGSIRWMSEKIRARSLSPVDLTEAYLKRIERLNPGLSAYTTVTADLARKEAKAAAQEIGRGRYRGPLHGIPYAAKDLLAVKGFPTRWGAKPYARQVFDYDATVIARLRAAGAVLLGKAAMIELAGGMSYRFASSSESGAAHNPWDKSRWTCGSSSGSGAIGAADLAAFALGSETWGSVICPSAMCGITGLRPTYGRVSRHGAMALSYSLDKVGVMARSAEDCELVFAAIAAKDPHDQSTFDNQHRHRPGVGPRIRQRIGWVSNAWTKLPKAIDRAGREARAELERRGARVTEIQLPKGPWEQTAIVTLAAECGTAFASFIDSGRIGGLQDPFGRVNGYLYREISAGDYLAAQRVRSALIRRMGALFRQVDVLAAPSLPITATLITADIHKELNFEDPLGAIGNLCGLPAVTVPCGLDEKRLPIGLQIVGPALGDDAVLEVTRIYQAHTKFHTKRPQ